MPKLTRRNLKKKNQKKIKPNRQDRTVLPLGVVVSISILLVFLIPGLSVVAYNYYKTIDNDKLLESQLTGLSIETDKQRYQAGETVEIVFVNNGGSYLEESEASSTYPSLPNFSGNNYGVGFVENYRNGSWVSVEPVWRCNDSCTEKCDFNQLIKPETEKIFKWRQTILTCQGFDKVAEISQAKAGKYRISTEVWSDELNAIRTVYSNEFIIIDSGE